jgi:hypothetical protein
LEMPKRSSKQKGEDPNKRAFRVMQQSTSEGAAEREPPKKKKNPAAVELGRLGGLKGGKARAKALSAKKRKEIAQKAAQARWRKKKPD